MGPGSYSRSTATGFSCVLAVLALPTELVAADVNPNSATFGNRTIISDYACDGHFAGGVDLSATWPPKPAASDFLVPENGHGAAVNFNKNITSAEGGDVSVAPLGGGLAGTQIVPFKGIVGDICSPGTFTFKMNAEPFQAAENRDITIPAMGYSVPGGIQTRLQAQAMLNFRQGFNIKSCSAAPISITVTTKIIHEIRTLRSTPTTIVLAPYAQKPVAVAGKLANGYSIGEFNLFLELSAVGGPAATAVACKQDVIVDPPEK